jgi:hypothetical protein
VFGNRTKEFAESTSKQLGDSASSAVNAIGETSTGESLMVCSCLNELCVLFYFVSIQFLTWCVHYSTPSSQQAFSEDSAAELIKLKGQYLSVTTTKEVKGTH